MLQSLSDRSFSRAHFASQNCSLIKYWKLKYYREKLTAPLKLSKFAKSSEPNDSLLLARLNLCGRCQRHRRLRHLPLSYRTSRFDRISSILPCPRHLFLSAHSLGTRRNQPDYRGRGTASNSLRRQTETTAHKKKTKCGKERSGEQEQREGKEYGKTYRRRSGGGDAEEEREVQEA